MIHGSWMKMTAFMAHQVTKKSCQPLMMENPEINPKDPSLSPSSSNRKRVRTIRRIKMKRRRQRGVISKHREVMTRQRAANLKRRRVVIRRIGSHSSPRAGSRLCPRRRPARGSRPRPRQMCISHRRPREWPPKPVPNHPSPAVQLQLQLTPRLQSVPWPLLSRIERAAF